VNVDLDNGFIKYDGLDFAPPLIGFDDMTLARQSIYCQLQRVTRACARIYLRNSFRRFRWRLERRARAAVELAAALGMAVALGLLLGLAAVAAATAAGILPPEPDYGWVHQPGPVELWQHP
jgi:hypothetical protein